MNMIIFSIFGLLLLSSCASLPGHDHQKDSVVSLNDDGSATACLGDENIASGLKLKAFDFVCRKVQTALIRVPRYEERCEKLNIGEVEVLRLEASHHVKLMPLNGYKVKVGTKVEKR